jgi:hypothetical protein
LQDYSLLVIVDNDAKIIHCGIIGMQQHDAAVALAVGSRLIRLSAEIHVGQEIGDHWQKYERTKNRESFQNIP